MSEIIIFTTVRASNGRTIGRVQKFPADTWDDHPDAHADFVDLYLKGPCEAFARREGVEVCRESYRVWWRRQFPWAWWPV